MSDHDLLLRRPETFLGLPALPPDALRAHGARVAVLGVPFDCGIHPFRVGAREGPAAVRHQSRLIRRFHPLRGDQDVPALLGAADCGDVAIIPAQPAMALPKIEQAAGQILDAGAVAIGIGGDGAVSLPLMRAAGRRHSGLVALHVDSHTDDYPAPPEDRYNPTTQFTCAAEEGAIDAQHSWHLGIRGFTFRQGVVSRSRGLGFRVVPIDELLARGCAQTIAEFRQGAAGRPVYLCWDMDGFDPAGAPGVCTPAWGGLSAREGIHLMRQLAGLRIVAMDFNTVSPAQDIDGMAAHLCAHMIAEAMLVLASTLGLIVGE
ncbi:MAG: arginase family protein [Acetobacteraceae bacterium]